jgi:hypothetical protein
MFTVICYECGSKIHPIREEDNKLYYPPHYKPGRGDSDGFCTNISEIPKVMLEFCMKPLKGE